MQKDTTNAALWFNKICKIKHMKPNYIHFKTNGKKPQNRKDSILLHGAQYTRSQGQNMPP
jgi:hypothetical protein